MDKKTINRLIRHISHGQNNSKRIHADTYRLGISCLLMVVVKKH